jgi:ABC-2 type transport system permease protein
MNNTYKKNLVALQTVLNREITRFIRIWTQTLLPPVITITLYFVIFGKLIGSQIRDIHGVSYMQYIVPGLAMMTIITNSYSNTSSSFFGAKFSKSIEEMLVSSMPVSIMMMGYMLGGTLRGIISGLVVLLIARCFTPFTIFSPVEMCLMSLLAAMLFSLAGIINGIFAKKFDDISFIPTFVLTPLTYLGGVFYSVSQLPSFWQSFAFWNPLLEIIDTFRHGMLGKSDVSVYHGFIMTGCLFLILLVWCIILLRKGTGLRT